jgi:AbrB family looped-hinge helix DNA binding protein
MKKQVKITSKGQVTVPIAIRRLLRVGPGDMLVFESGKDAVKVHAVLTGSPFEKYQGIGNPGISSGRKAINQWIRHMRGD